MARTTARNQQDVDKMTSRERLWDSLNYSYGKKRENSDEEFRKAYSQADRQMLSRGMQRSSYGAQTLANLDKQRVDASNDIYDQQIADYENRLQQARQQELENERWEREFAAGREDAAWNKAYQEGRANAQDTQFQMNFNEGQRQFNENMGYQKGRDAVSDRQWQQQFSEGQRQFNENMGYQRERAGAQDTQWQQQFDYQKERAKAQDTQWQQQFDYQKGRDTVADQQWQQTFNYQQGRDTVADEQWQKSFDQGTTDTDQALATSYIQAIAAQGGTPSDELLARARLSREDYNAMLQQMASGGGGYVGSSGSGGGGRSSNKKNKGQQNGQDAMGFDAFIQNLSSGVNSFADNISSAFAGTSAPSVTTLNMNDNKNHTKDILRNSNQKSRSTMG